MSARESENLAAERPEAMAAVAPKDQPRLVALRQGIPVDRDLFGEDLRQDGMTGCRRDEHEAVTLV